MPELPNSARAIIPVEKIRDYVLNPEHPDGAHKARVVSAATGLRRSDYQSLIAQIRQGIVDHEAVQHHLRRGRTQFYVELPIKGPKGTIVVRTIWIYEDGSDVPRLTTLYPTRHGV
jgi:filamentous hemagglutinin